MNQQTSMTVNELALENCDKEPIHIPGHIQDIAVLVAIDADYNVEYCSANAEIVFDAKAKDLLGQSLTDHLPREMIHELNNVLSLSTVRGQREHVAAWTNPRGDFDLWAHLSDGKPVLEFEHSVDEDMTSAHSIRNVRFLLARIGQMDDLQAALQNAVTGLRDLTGFDRVLVYQFDGNGDGEIKAEAKGPIAESFMGLRFPAWDIPKQAREIIKKIRVRLVADVNAEPVPVLAQSNDMPPLDMTLAACRGQSAIHSEYLRNMGVLGNMTLSIVVGDELWGLFAFHNFTPRSIGPTMRGSAELFVQLFSMQLAQHFALKSTYSFDGEILDAAEGTAHIAELVAKVATLLCEQVAADGVAVISKKNFFQHGSTPAEAEVRAIADLLVGNKASSCVFDTSLIAHGFEVAPTAGALVHAIDDDNGEYLIFFRDEAVRSVTWAGAPEKEVIHDQGGPRLLPRASFAAYKESIKNQSRPWDADEVGLAKHISSSLIKANFHRISKAERKRNIYIDELNHRIRNILALIRSLARRTKETSTSLESYIKALESRIAALGAAHDLAANRMGSGVSLRELFETEVSPFVENDGTQLNITGDDFLIRADIAPTFALIAHELTTNAVKHGALSDKSGGRVHIDLSGDAEGVIIQWTEKGGSAVEGPVRKGFGLQLITDSVPYELDGKSEVEFLPEGLQAKIWLPAKLITPMRFVTSMEGPAENGPGGMNKDIPSRVLVVEDSMIVAIDLAEMLLYCGAEEIEKCASVAQAKATLKAFTPDFAILDIALRDELSFEIADMLHERGIPFVFATGYGSKFIIPPHLQRAPVLKKPVSLVKLKAMIKKVYVESQVV